jgi:hypothetical protein
MINQKTLLPCFSPMWRSSERNTMGRPSLSETLKKVMLIYKSPGGLPTSSTRPSLTTLDSLYLSRGGSWRSTTVHRSLPSSQER